MNDLKENNLISASLKKYILNGNISEVANWLSKKNNTKNINYCTDSNGDSILHVAVNSKKPAMIKLILGYASDIKLNINLINKEGKTAFQVALQNEKNNLFTEWKCVLAFISACQDPSIQSHEALIEAALRDNLDMTEKLLKAGVSANGSFLTGEFPLHIASQKGYGRIVSSLLEHRANITLADTSVTNRDGKTPIEIVLDKEKDNVLQDWKIVKIFIAKGPKEQEQSRFHYALCEAIARNNTEVIKFCLANGVSPDFPDKDGNYPLHIAAQNGQHAIISLLLRRQPDTTKQDRNGKTPIQIAVDYAKEKGWQSVISIIDHLIYLIDYNRDSSQPEILDMFYNENINSLNYAINTAINQGAHEIVVKLLAKLQKTVGLYSRTICSFPLAETIGRLQEICDSGYFLHSAIQTSNSQEIVLALLKHYADPTKKNGAGKTPIEIAVDNAPKHGWQYVYILISQLLNDVRNHYSDEQKSKSIYINQLLYALNTALQTAQPASMLEHFQNSLLADPIAYLRSNLEELVTVYIKRWQERDLKGLVNAYIQRWQDSDNPNNITDFLKSELNQIYQGASYKKWQECDLEELATAYMQKWQECDNPNNITDFLKRELNQIYRAASYLLFSAARNPNPSAALPFIDFLLSYDVDINVTDKDGKTPIQIMADLGNWEGVLTMAKAKKNVNDYVFIKADGYALAKASQAEKWDVVTTLLELGVDPNVPDEFGNVTLHYAVEADNAEMVMLLLSKNADSTLISTAKKVDGSRKTAIELAATNIQSNDGKCFLAFIEHRAYLAKWGYFDYAIAAASSFNRIDIVRTLLRMGANPNNQSYANRYALHISVAEGDLDMIELLLDYKADVTLKTTHGRKDEQKTAIDLAADKILSDDDKCLLFFIEGYEHLIKSGYFDYALTLAVRSDKTDIIKTLLLKGASPNKASYQKEYPLHIAARYGNLNTLNLLLAHGANVNLLTNGENSALTLAVMHDHWDCVKVLAAKESNKNSYGCKLALSYAVGQEKLDLVKEFLANGTTPNSDSKNINPLYNAVEKENAALIELLIQHNADITKTGAGFRAGLPPIVTAAIKTFYHSTFTKNWDCVLAFVKNKNDDTGEAGYDFVLRLAVLDNNIPVVIALLKAKADPNQIRFSKKNTTYQAKFSDSEFLFSEHYATGNTALHDAAEKGNKELLSLLLFYNADINATNNADETPLDIAKKHKHQDCINYLQSMGNNNSTSVNMSLNIEEPDQVGSRKGIPVAPGSAKTAAKYSITRSDYAESTQELFNNQNNS